MSEQAADKTGSTASPANTRHRPGMLKVVNWLNSWEDAAFILVAAFLLLAALVMLGHSVVSIRSISTAAIFTFVHDLLFVMIILELFGTVTAYLKERRISIKPFLFIGIIFAIRKILMVGAKLTAGGEANHGASAPLGEAGATVLSTFSQEMIEMGVGAVIVLVLVVAYYILAKVQMTDDECVGCLGRRGKFL